MRGARAVIFVCFVGWLFDFYDLALISYLLPHLTKEFALTTSQQSWLLGVGLGTSGFGGIAFGWLSDRYGRRRILASTILLYAIGTGLSAFSTSFGMFVFFRALAGLG